MRGKHPISPCLWFDSQAEEAAQFYTSIFKNSRIVRISRYSEAGREIDHYWERLSEGGDRSAQQCGWLKDRYGVSWQVVPTVLSEMLTDRDPGKSGRAMEAMLQMKKLDIARLKRAYGG